MKATLGNLRELVTIQEELLDLDRYGTQRPAWQSVASDVPAQVEDLGGTETHRAGQVQSGRTFRVTMRHLAWPTAKCRMVWDGRILEIDSVRDTDGRKRWLECLCREV